MAIRFTLWWTLGDISEPLEFRDISQYIPLECPAGKTKKKYLKEMILCIDYRKYTPSKIIIIGRGSFTLQLMYCELPGHIAPILFRTYGPWLLFNFPYGKSTFSHPLWEKLTPARAASSLDEAISNLFLIKNRSNAAGGWDISPASPLASYNLRT